MRARPKTFHDVSGQCQNTLFQPTTRPSQRRRRSSANTSCRPTTTHMSLRKRSTATMNGQIHASKWSVQKKVGSNQPATIECMRRVSTSCRFFSNAAVCFFQCCCFLLKTAASSFFQVQLIKRTFGCSI